MKLTIALGVVFVLAVGVTLASPIGNEHHRHGKPDDQPHIHRSTPRTPELYELLSFAELLVNDTFENDTDERIQNFQQTLNEEGLVPVNVLQTPKTELPENQTSLEPQNATGTVGSLEEDYPIKASRREYRSNDTVVSEDDREEDVENYASIHGNCSHCMDEFKNATNIKYLGCMCSLFATEHPTELDTPLTSKLFENVSCHQSIPSEEACSKHCVSMVASHNELKDNMICTFLQHTSDTKVYLQAKLCEDDSKWTFTGVSSPGPICCHMGAMVPC